MAKVEPRTDSPAPMPIPLVGLAVLVMVLIFVALLMVPAGRLDWMLGWLYVGLVVVTVITYWACLRRWNPDLIERRMRFGEGTKTWDKVWAVLYAPVMGAIYGVAGLEALGGVSSSPGVEWFLGLVIFVPGAAMLIWSMVVNPFFEKTVRIQTDRGQYVIDTGLYVYVRHPGYVGFGGWILSAPLLLASAWAFMPAVLADEKPHTGHHATETQGDPHCINAPAPWRHLVTGARYAAAPLLPCKDDRADASG